MSENDRPLKANEMVVTREMMLEGYRYHNGWNADGSPRVRRGEYVLVGRTRFGNYIVKNPAS